MKQFRFSCMLLFATMVFFLSSCGGGSGEKKAGDDTTGTVTTAPVPVNTIVTTPQLMVVVTHKVADYAKWKPSFDAHDSVRLANGLHRYVIGRGVTDTNMVLVAMKADDLAKAKAFSQSPDLKNAMKKAGVTGPPTIHFINTTWQDTANIGAAPRSLTTFTVKDWDAWIKSFDDGKQERIDNGLLVRTVGHDADDNKKVALVTALSDTAKAFAYYKSDALKKRREAGGLTSEPKRFLFTIAHRY